jgi:hypothetical protein
MASCLHAGTPTLTAAWSHRFNSAGEDSDAAQLQLRIAF